MGLANFAIDLAAVFSASRSVATKHVALRSRQINAYTRTSSILKNRPTQPAPAADAYENKIDLHAKDLTRQRSAKHKDDVDLASSVQAEKLAHEPAQSQPSNSSSLPNVKTESTVSVTQAHEPPTRDHIPSFRETFQQSTTTANSRNVEDELDVPPNVDTNIFHTQRGSKILDSLKEDSRPHLEQAPKTERPAAKEHPMRNWPPPPPQPVEEEPTTTATQILEAQAVQPKANETPAINQASKGSIVNDASAEKVPEAPTAPKVDEEVIEVAKALASEANEQPKPVHSLRESAVPASRFSRLWNYGGLAAGMLGGAMTESVSRAFGGGGTGSVLLSGKNMERLVAKLSRMRGAALKLGQMMSFQDTKMLPPPIQEVLQRVQDRADYMPAWQRDRVMAANLGVDWRELYSEFEEMPIAAASIGQVHKAVLKSNGKPVAIKVQFPGVADSINSDLDNLSILLNATKLLPKGLYLNKTIDNARVELGWECNYEREAECVQRYRELLASEDDIFLVPNVYLEACGKQVITMDFMDGIAVTRITSFTQEQRDWIGTQILRLSLREITEFKFMQTDPNWTNFLYNADNNKLELLDFGASREYPEEFVIQYVQLLEAASRSDRETVKTLSESLGYLTGHESKIMLDAHIQSVLTLAEPFLDSAPEVYDFKDQTITERVKALIPVMLHERLAPPPEETYSLHRKLSGAFLLCAKLGSKVRCRDMFKTAVEKSGYVS